MELHTPPPLRKLARGKVYQLLEPGPVVLLTTSRRGRANVMTMSWHTMMDFEPPLIGCVVSEGNYSFTALRTTRECVIAVPPVDLAATTVRIGNCSGRDCDKFARFDLLPLKAAQVDAPLLASCIANLECRVVDTRLVNRYNFFVLEVCRAWIDPARRNSRTFHHHGYGRFVADGEAIRLPSRMR